jgi:hypothetical protein
VRHGARAQAEQSGFAWIKTGNSRKCGLKYVNICGGANPEEANSNQQINNNDTSNL